MVRRLVAMALVVATAGFITAEALAADQPAPTLIGLYLTTRYPALTVKAGETATIDLSVHNYKLPPQQLTLSVPEVVQGWKATVLGGGQPIGAVEVAPDSDERLQLRLEPPSGTGAGDYHFTVEAKGANAQCNVVLPVETIRQWAELAVPGPGPALPKD